MPGEFRSIPVQIGSSARFVPPPPEHVLGCLDAFEKYIHSEHSYDPLVEAFILHYQFEAIHPFTDGNGRVGRLLLAVMIREWCGLSKPWLYMSPFFEKRKDEYIDTLFNVSSTGDWESWIVFCLRGVIEQSKDAAQRCDLLLALRQKFHVKLNEVGGSVRLSSIVEDLFMLPVVVPTLLAKKHAITYPTARADIEKLCDVGILKEIEGASQKTYFAHEIFEITYNDVF